MRLLKSVTPSCCAGACRCQLIKPRETRQLHRNTWGMHSLRRSSLISLAVPYSFWQNVVPPSPSEFFLHNPVRQWSQLGKENDVYAEVSILKWRNEIGTSSAANPRPRRNCNSKGKEEKKTLRIQRLCPLGPGHQSRLLFSGLPGGPQEKGCAWLVVWRGR